MRKRWEILMYTYVYIYYKSTNAFCRPDKVLDRMSQAQRSDQGLEWADPDEIICLGKVAGKEQMSLQGRTAQDETLGNTYTYGNSIKPYTLTHSKCSAIIDWAWNKFKALRKTHIGLKESTQRQQGSLLCITTILDLTSGYYSKVAKKYKGNGILF